MHFSSRHLKRPPRHVLLIILAIAFLVPGYTWSNTNPFNGDEPFEYEFLVTAYYSPLPGQCCYVKGGLTADRI